MYDDDVNLRRHFYGACAVSLGLWEATSYGTRKIPTITTTVRSHTRRRPWLRLLVAAWLLGLGRHLLSDEA